MCTSCSSRRERDASPQDECESRNVRHSLYIAIGAAPPTFPTPLARLCIAHGSCQRFMTKPQQSYAFVAPTPLRHHRSRQTRTSTPCKAPIATSQQPRTARTQTAPVLNTAKNESQSPRSLRPPSPLPYFAYFSNMNPNVLGPNSAIRLRRVRPRMSKPARLPGYSLKFDVPGIPPEPVFANLQLDRRSEYGVHGVLHWVTSDQFQSIARSEGVIPLPFADFARVQHVTCILADGTRVKARTIAFEPPRFSAFITSALRPSRRYVQTAIYGAEFYEVDISYVDNVLRNIKTENGPLGAFGLYSTQRPHVLDRPRPNERFGRAVDEIYSPYNHIPEHIAPAMDKLRHVDHKVALRLARLSGKARSEYRKKLYYLPGIDGNGKGIVGQIKNLEDEGIYDVSAVVYPPGNRQCIADMASDILALIKNDAGSDAVCIFGESMGGMLSLVCASENQKRQANQMASVNLEVVMMLNPATSYSRSSTRQLWETLISIGIPEDAYKRLLPYALFPFLLDLDSVGSNFAPELVPRLRKMLTSLSAISDVLPMRTVQWRISLLNSFYLAREEYKSLCESRSGIKMAVIASMNDNLLPSFSELKRLERLIPGIHTMALPYGGHAAAMDPRFNLAAFLRAFNANKRVSTRSQVNSSQNVLRRRAAFRRRFASRGVQRSAKFSRQELRIALDYVQTSTREFSPVFIGEENIPEYDVNRPVLFVSNHTLMGWLDTSHPVTRVLQSRGVLIRALAHPYLLAGATQSFPMVPSVDVQTLKKFGVTTLTPNSLVQNLSEGNWMLLFPGGAREALKDPRNSKYELFWPQDPEFVRSCAMFGAQIVPLSSVGTEDSFIPFLNASQVKSVIDTGSRLIGRPFDWSFAADSVRSWRGESGEDRPMVPPLAIPTEADRVYYRFGKAIDVPEICVTDKNAERVVYEQARDAVKEGIQILLERRVRDEYRSRTKRRQFARRFGAQVEPPAGCAWLWRRNGAYLDDDLQP
eukprot:TRINITY_DN13970_c0_g1_i1.p1 TRINITY_DN13970_c0_g1~~TRINITY_DN13970_c0_g1_i1.p1  ORF type:complete len:985 (-),score=127.88 TRINITY_DN13970_c0_g1_i1:696-3650(-)